MKIVSRVLVLWIVSSVSPHPSFAQSDWSWRNPLPQGNALHAVASLDDLTAVAVGTAGTIMRTADGGESWSVRSGPNESASLTAVSFVDAKIGTAVGGDYAGHSTILRTADFSLSEAKSTVDRDVTTFALQAGGGLRRAFECGMW